MAPVTFVTVKNPSARISIHIFTEVLDVKNKTTVHRVGAAKLKRKAIRSGTMWWSSTPNMRRLTQ